MWGKYFASPKPELTSVFFVLQKELQELQKRLVVLGCQLRKAEVSKRTYEVATEKLIRFAEVGLGLSNTHKKAILPET